MCNPTEPEQLKPVLTSSNYYAKMGNIGQSLSILNTLTFVVAVVTFVKPNSHNTTTDYNVFDAEWLKDGFCVSNKEIPYWNSHDMCLYADIILASIFAIMYYCLHKAPGMKLANDLTFYNIPGIVAHGLGHGGIGKAIRDDEIPMESEDILSQITKDGVKSLFLYFIIPTCVFWMPLLKATMKNVSWQKVLPLSFLFSGGNILLPRQFGFTYVQTVLMLSFSISELSKKSTEKTFEYALYAFLVSIPVGLVGWMESTQCSNFVMDYLGGHLVYDAYIPLSGILFYLACYFYHGASNTKEKTI